jgi:hypothetical protein
MNTSTVSPSKPCTRRKFTDERLVELHSRSLSIPKLAMMLGVSREPVRRRMKKLGLKPNCKRGGVPRYEKVGTEEFRCSSCRLVKPLRQRQGTICCDCHHKRYVSTREGALRFRYSMKKSKAKRKGITFSITYEEFKRKFEEQDGKDFYTSEQMCFDYGQGRSAATGSVDRRDNDGGYTPDNIVFCRLEINSKKGNRPVGRLTEQLALEFPDRGGISLG